MVLDVLRTFVRRWYIILVGLLLTGGLVYGALQASPPEYHARGLVLLLPSEVSVGKGGNPFLGLSGLEAPAGVLVASLSSAPERERVETRAPTVEYTIGIDSSTRGPVIAVDILSASREETMDTLAYLIDRIPAELTRLQQQVDVPENAMINSMQLTVDKRPAVNRGGTIRAVIAALVVGLVGTGSGAYAFEALMQRRQMRASGRRRARGRRSLPREEKQRDVRRERDAGEEAEADRDVGDDTVREEVETSWSGR